MPDKNDKLLDLILSQLKEISKNQKDLADEIQDISLELTKVQGIKYPIADIKKWKEEMEKFINLDDLKDIKNSVEDYKKSKTKVYTLMKIISSVVALATLVFGAIEAYHYYIGGS